MKASLVINYHLNNKIFNVDDKTVNRDDYAYSIWLLKQRLQFINVDLSTCDINKLSDSDIALYFDVPNYKVQVETNIPYLFLFESEVIKLSNWGRLSHNQYKKVFTWHDDLVDNKKYFKMNFSHKFPENRDVHNNIQKKFESKKLCTLIAGNKKVNHPLELYSERERTIRWFEKNTKNSFDFYGVGWDKYTSANRYIRYILSKLRFVNKLLQPVYPSYQGAVNSKKETLSCYKFAICYENAQMIPGYITEKIFDCFFASCIPIYWGAPNITDHIPANCFIDRRKFNSHEELYDFITNMSEDEYNVIQVNIENYLFSEKAAPYRADTFADTIVQHVLSDLKL
jgi:hypothetical protein